jgi:hypothetical protein
MKQVTPQISSSHYSEDPYFASNGKKDTKVSGKNKNYADCFPDYKGIARHQDAV